MKEYSLLLYLDNSLDNQYTIPVGVHHPRHEMRPLTHCLYATKDNKSCAGIMKIAQSDPHTEKRPNTKQEVGVILSTVTARQCLVNTACPATNKLTQQITTPPGSYSTALMFYACGLCNVIKLRDFSKEMVQETHFGIKSVNEERERYF